MWRHRSAGPTAQRSHVDLLSPLFICVVSARSSSGGRRQARGCPPHGHGGRGSASVGASRRRPHRPLWIRWPRWARLRVPHRCGAGCERCTGSHSGRGAGSNGRRWSRARARASGGRRGRHGRQGCRARHGRHGDMAGSSHGRRGRSRGRSSGACWATAGFPSWWSGGGVGSRRRLDTRACFTRTGKGMGCRGGCCGACCCHSGPAAPVLGGSLGDRRAAPHPPTGLPRRLTEAGDLSRTTLVGVFKFRGLWWRGGLSAVDWAGGVSGRWLCGVVAPRAKTGTQATHS